MKKQVIKDIVNESATPTSFATSKYKKLIESILADEDDSVEGLDELEDTEDDDFDFSDDETATEDEDFASEESDDFDTEEVADDELEDEGSVTIEFTKAEVDLLRSILAKIDGEEEVEDDMAEEEVADDDEAEVDEFDDEADEDEFSEEEEEECEEEDDDDEFTEEDEEVEVAGGSPSQFAKTETDGAPKRKKGTPAVNRNGKADAPDINSAVASHEGEAAEGLGAPKRTKKTPAVNRSKTASSRVAPGKHMYEIGK